MKIAIIGGGISGCTAYLSLKKHLPASRIDSIKIYEAYSTPHSSDPPSTNTNGSKDATSTPTPVIGGGLGLSPNGLRVLSRLDQSQALVQDIVRSGYAISTMSLKTKNGKVLADLDSTSDAGPVPEVFLSDSSSHEQNDDSSTEMRMNMIASSRHGLWKCLRDRVPDEDVITKRVEDVTPRPDGLNIVLFDDGVQVEVDLVIGADGLRSATRRGMFRTYTEGGEERYEYRPQYEGLIGVGGFTPLLPSLKTHLKPGTMSLLFSGNGFFGYFPSSSSSSPSTSTPSPYTIAPPGETLSWWSTYAYPSPPPTPSSISLSTITTDLKTRHANWNDPIIQSILATLTVENIYPTWTSPVLKTWEKHGVILVGDAAHALPSTSGQGASQGMEDGEALGMFLAHYITEGREGGGEEDVVRTKRILTHAAKHYIELRKPHVEEILNEAKRMQNNKRDVGWVGEMVMYAFLWIMGFFPSMVSRKSRAIVNYNVTDEVKKVMNRNQEG
ncbi:FAD-dependent oxidoreductase [Aspergillus affinis]|uniref:FAD-dependent oxidoreductase n=1 Tax=Aspergillus affinis TaxID=1070780 RepID=UPI0022FE4F43|nr:uncharacterized protein KD926_009739 [Aspergillus affinis]KAI9039297.1 hypothetical protein KD926_009739 [Aspergillus affinis]